MLGHFYQISHFADMGGGSKKGKEGKKGKNPEPFCLFCPLCLFCFPCFTTSVAHSGNSGRTSSELGESFGRPCWLKSKASLEASKQPG
jgi:hypothetical protein